LNLNWIEIGLNQVCCQYLANLVRWSLYLFFFQTHPFPGQVRDLFSKQINEKENTVSTWCMLTVSIFIQRNLNHSQTLEHEFDLSTLLLHISVLFVNWMLDLRENEISLFDTKINRKGQKSFHAKKNQEVPSDLVHWTEILRFCVLWFLLAVASECEGCIPECFVHSLNSCQSFQIFRVFFWKQWLVNLPYRIAISYIQYTF